MDEIMVSVIMPAYNVEKFIERAIQSVLSQTIELELIVINDCSEDATENVVKRYQDGYKVILIQNETNLGAAESRNAGIKRARGKYIAFLDADDWWAEGKLKVQVELLEKLDAVLCCTGRELMYEDGASSGKVIGVPEMITYQMLLKTNCIPCSSVVLKTKAAREFYMSHQELHEDYILWLKILKKYDLAYGINVPFLKSRMSSQGKSRNKFKSAKMQYGVYRLIGMGKIKSVFYMIYYMANGILKYGPKMVIGNFKKK